MHNGNGHGHGKRWLLIGLLILGGFWLMNDAYEDGYRDALVRSGQVTDVRHWRGGDGPDFPWGLLILGGIGYIAWRKGAFDRFNGPGGPFGGPGGPFGGPAGNGDNGQRGVQHYGAGPAPTQTPGAPAPGQAQGFGPAFRGPRAFFDEWHRQSHEAAQARYPAQTAHPAPPVPPASYAGQQQAHGSDSAPAAEMPQSAPPTPPAPDYWNSMSRPESTAPASGTPSAPSAPSAPVPPPAAPDAQSGGPGPAPERW